MTKINSCYSRPFYMEFPLKWNSICTKYHAKPELQSCKNVCPSHQRTSHAIELILNTSILLFSHGYSLQCISLVPIIWSWCAVGNQVMFLASRPYLLEHRKVCFDGAFTLRMLVRMLRTSIISLTQVIRCSSLFVLPTDRYGTGKHRDIYYEIS